MATKNLKTRIQHKTDTSANWALATNLIPLKGEVCFFSDLNKVKIGDGVTLLSALKFEGISTGDDEIYAGAQVDGFNENIADSYSSSETYEIGDLCIYQGKLYRCVSAISTAEAWTAAHWERRNVSEEIDGLKDLVGNIETLLSAI